MDTSKFDDYFAQVKARDARQTATKLTLDPTQPNDAAEGVQIGKELGMPPGQVMAAPKVFRERLAQERAAKALADAPKLSDWLRNEPVASAMAKDDLDNLSWFERNLGAFGRATGRGTRRLAAGPDALVATEAATQLGDVGKSYDDILAEELAKVGTADPGLRVNAMMVARLRHDAIKDADPARVEEIRERGSEALLQVRQVMDQVQAIPMSKGAAAFRDGALQSADNSVMGVLRAFASDPIGGAAFLAETAAESLPVIGLSAATAVVTGSPIAAAGVAGVGSIASEGPSEFDAFLREKGVKLETPEDAAGVLATPELLQEAAGRGMTKGAVVGLFDALSAGMASKALLNTPVGNMLAQGLTQMLFGAGGEYASQKALGGATDWRDIVIEALAEGVTAPVEVAGMAGSRVRAMAKDAMRQPGQTAEILDQVSQQAQASQLRARSPEDFKRAIEASGAGDQMIYVPAVGLNEYFQTAGLPLDDATLQSLNIDPATFAEMEMSGGRVAIPVSSFAAHIAGTDMEAWVRENATIDPDELALSEAASYADLVPADMADAYEQDVAAMRDEDARKASDVQVYDGIYGMLRSAGRGVEVAAREAQVMTAYFRTQAERIGEDALELARRFNLDIRGPGQESPLPRRRGELDVLLNEIRSGVKDKPGDTLTEFVVGQGGIQDRGGDVGALEGPKGLVGESAAAIRERESMPTLPGTMPATGRGLALDEMGRRAVEAGYFPELMGEAAGLNKGEAADLGRALLDALNEEASGRVRYREGEGPNEARAALAEELSRRGLDPVHMTNDEIAAALEGREFAQAAAFDMSPGGGSKTVKVGSTTLIYGIDRKGETAELISVRTPTSKRGQGGGRAAISAFLAETDARGMTVKLAASPLDKKTRLGPLVAFYESLGFNKTGRNINMAGDPEMLREPQKNRTFDQDKRGSIEIPAAGPDGRTTIINLYEAANLSTFFHEAGHFTLEVQAALAADPNAPQQLRDDMAAIREYLGADEGKPFTTEQHETWARSLEAYIMEGKAPSLALADVFARVKAWLTRIYRTVAGLNVTLTPEIREVMDRMLATDAEIAEARADLSAGPLFREKPAGMSDADWATYQRMARRSSEQAEAKLLSRTMEAVRRKTERWWKDERKAVRAEVEARMNALPQYRLVEAMANGRYLDAEGNATDAPDVRIDRKLLVEQFGEGVLAELSVPRLGGKRAIYGADGISPVAAAQMFGFRSAPDMIDILQNTTKRRDAIEAETDRIMLERHGDPFTDGSIEQEALDAIHNEQTQQKHVAEARQMAAQMGRDTRGMTARHYRQRAARMLERMTVREATAPARFLAAERKAGRDAERAFAAVARGNSAKLAEALQAKEQQVLNAAFYDLSRQAEKEVARARERFRDYAKDSVRKKLEGGYIEQIDAILDRYDFRKRGPGQVQRSETLAAFIQRMTDEGREAELAIDPRLMDEARQVHYTRLPLEEMRGLIDTVANLDHLGRFKQKLINARRERDFAASKDRVIGQLETVGRDAVARPRGQAAQALANYLSLAKTGDTIISELDGLAETGVIFDELRRDIFAAESQEAARRIEMEGRFSDIIKAHYTKAQITDMAKPRNVPVASARLWAKSEILAVALNTGNESNFQRLTDDGVPQERRLTRDQVQGLIATLDKNDWRFVQGVWDMMDSYSGELEAVHKRRTGTKLKRVQPMMMVGAPSFVTGGYYPLKYDKDRSAFADRDEGSAWDRIIGTGHGSRIEVASGMTVARKASARGRPVRLDLGVPIEGMRDTIRVITLSEAVDNSARLLRDGEVKQTFFDRGLQNEWRTLELWLEDIASGPIFHGDSLNVGARVLKNNLTLMFLSFNLKTTVLQVTGLAQSAAVIGKRNMAQGIMAYLRHPQDMVKQVADASAFMRERQRTFHKDFTDRMSDPTKTDPIRGKLSQAKETMAQWGFAPIQLMQFYAVDVPTWAGAYRARLEAGDSHEAAAEYADLMVDRSQGGGFMGSRSAVSRGTLGRNARQLDFVRFFSTLGGYMITKYNRGVLETKRGVQALRSDEPARVRYAMAGNAAINLALLYVVEAALMAVLWGALTDEDEPEDYAKFLLKETGMAMVGGLPLVRDFVGGAVNGYGSGGMYQTVGEIPARILTQIMQGENDKAARSAFGSGVGAVTGLPTTATLRAIEGLVGDDDQTWADMFFGKNPLKD